MTRRQLTDAQCRFVEPYLPIGRYGPCPERLREQFEGVIWRLRSCGRWREMPAEFGPWATVYGRFRVWRDAGVFTDLPDGLIAGAPAWGERTCRWSAWIPPRSAPTTMPRGCASTSTSWRPRKKRRRSRRQPGKKGWPEAQNGQAERRCIRRRHKLRLKEALLGRSRVVWTARFTWPPGVAAVRAPARPGGTAATSGRGPGRRCRRNRRPGKPTGCGPRSRVPGCPGDSEAGGCEPSSRR